MDDETREKLKLKFGKFFKDNKIKKLIFILGAIGIALIFISNFISKNTNTLNEQSQADFSKSIYNDLEKYKISIENHLGEIISKIEGAGKTEVFLTLENGNENVYAVNHTQNNSSDKSGNKSESIESEYFSIRDSNGKENGMLLKVVEPGVRGVVVVCSGADNLIIKEKVLEAVTKALNISSARVCVSKLSQQMEE